MLLSLLLCIYAKEQCVDQSSYEHEAQKTLELSVDEFLDQRLYLCHPLAKLYERGDATDLLGYQIPQKPLAPIKAAYWYIEAVKSNDENARQYIKNLMGDKFDVLNPNAMHLIAQKIEQQAKALGKSFTEIN